MLTTLYKFVGHLAITKAGWHRENPSRGKLCVQTEVPWSAHKLGQQLNLFFKFTEGVLHARRVIRSLRLVSAFKLCNYKECSARIS